MRYLFVLLLAGCVTYDKPGSTEADYNRDMYECEKDVAPVQDAARRLPMIRRCMTVKGWTAS